MNFSLSDAIVMESKFERSFVLDPGKMDMSATVENQVNAGEEDFFRSIFNMQGYRDGVTLFKMTITFISKVDGYDDTFSKLHINEKCQEVFFKAYEKTIKDYVATTLRVSTLTDVILPTFKHDKK